MCPKIPSVRVGIRTQVCEMPKAMFFLFMIPYCIPRCIYSLLKKLCFSELMCFLIDTLCIDVWFTDQLLTLKQRCPKTECGWAILFTVENNLVLIMLKRDDNGCLWEVGPHLLNFTFLTILLMSLEFSIIAWLPFLKNK